MASIGYLMQASNLYDSIPIKTVRTLLTGKLVRSSPQELEFQYGESSFIFVYRFGCIVFFNLSNEIIDSEKAKLKSVLGGGLSDPTSETYQLNVGDFPTKVEFEYVELKKLDLDHLRLVAVTLGQSAGLEYFEVTAEKMLTKTSMLLKNLSEVGKVSMQSKELVKIIGSTASTRQHVISNLAILDPPDETWKSTELERFFKEIQQNFDIELRFRTLDRKLTLIQDNIEILADLAASRRNTFLEALIVALIVIELAIALLEKLH